MLSLFCCHLWAILTKAVLHLVSAITGYSGSSQNCNHGILRIIAKREYFLSIAIDHNCYQPLSPYCCHRVSAIAATHKSIFNLLLCMSISFKLSPPLIILSPSLSQVIFVHRCCTIIICQGLSCKLQQQGFYTVLQYQPLKLQQPGFF